MTQTQWKSSKKNGKSDHNKPHPLVSTAVSVVSQGCLSLIIFAFILVIAAAIYGIFQPEPL